MADRLNTGDALLYFPSTGGTFQGECRGLTRRGWVRVQVTHENGIDGIRRALPNPRLVITTPRRITTFPADVIPEPRNSMDLPIVASLPKREAV
jgi:hypothetical protein